MSSSRCARCLRERPESSATGAFGFWVATQGAWTTIDGEDICPSCQTDDERASLAPRIVAAIKAEIERRQREGIPSDDLEAALIGFAMEVDQQGDDTAPATSNGVGTRRKEAATASTVDLLQGPQTGDALDRGRAAGWGNARVAVTGAFLTGAPLAIRMETYDGLQEGLGAKLSADWSVEGLRREGGTYESGGGFTQAVPLVIARREGGDLLSRLEQRVDRGRFPSLRSVKPKSLSIDFYDLGVAVLIAWFDISPDDQAESDVVARAVKELVLLRPHDGARSSLVDALQNIAYGANREYCNAVAEGVPKPSRVGSWLSRGPDSSVGERPRRDPMAVEPGRLLWLHPVHVKSVVPPEPAAKAARELAPTFRRTIEVDGGLFVPGIGSSAVVVTEEPNAAEDARAAATPVRLTQLHWAYYALYIEIDRGLLHILNQERWTRPASLEKKEDDAEDVFADYVRVMDARARLDSYLSSLGGDELAIWEAISAVQKFDAVVSAVERKLEALDKLARRRVEQANEDRARRIQLVLGFLSTLALISLTAALISLSVGNKPSWSLGPYARLAFATGAFAVAVGLTFLFFVRSARRVSRSGRRRDRRRIERLVGGDADAAKGGRFRRAVRSPRAEE